MDRTCTCCVPVFYHHQVLYVGSLLLWYDKSITCIGCYIPMKETTDFESGGPYMHTRRGTDDVDGRREGGRRGVAWRGVAWRVYLCSGRCVVGEEAGQWCGHQAREGVGFFKLPTHKGVYPTGTSVLVGRLSG